MKEDWACQCTIIDRDNYSPSDYCLFMDDGRRESISYSVKLLVSSSCSSGESHMHTQADKRRELVKLSGSQDKRHMNRKETLERKGV